MTEVVAHVITAERKHGHRVSANFPHRACCCRRSFRAHRCADIDAGAPVESLENERHRGCSAAAEDDGADGDAAGIFPRGIDRGTLRSWRSEAGVWMCGLCARFFGDFRSPLLALPIEAFGRRCVRHTFPPDAAVRSKRDICENGVFCEGGHGVAVFLYGSAWGYAEKSGLWIYRPQKAAFIRTNPGNVITHRPDFPAFESLGRDQHRDICFSAPGCSPPRKSMGPALQPSARAMLEAIRSPKHFLPRSAFPP